MRTTLLIAMTLVGCGVGEAGDMGLQDPSDTTGSALADDNGLDFNGLGSNGLSSNGLSSNGLGSNGLSSNGLGSNGLSSNGLSSNGLTPVYGYGSTTLNAWFDSNTTLNPAVLKYFTKCAMPYNTSLGYSRGGVNYLFDGVFGLAPSLRQGLAMTASEQRWVSACMLAHVNANATSVSVSFRSPNSAALASTSTEKTAYPIAEAAFYGNLFSSTVEKNVCNVLDTLRWGRTSGRECSSANTSCGMTLVGSCSTLCTKGAVTSDGFTSCKNAAGVATTEVVATYIKPFCGDGICNEGCGCIVDCGGCSFSGSRK